MNQSKIKNSASSSNPMRVYLDYQSTTPVDPRVMECMLPWFTEYFGNAHSSQHSFGLEAAEAVEEARNKIARVLGAEGREIIFTSGATESNNLAIKGASRFASRYRKGKHIIVLETEHKCVLESCTALAGEGFRTTILKVGTDGLVDLDKLADAIQEDTVLVSIMAVNNEIGVIQPLEKIGQLCQKNGILFHTDAAQAVGKIEVNVNNMHVDLMSVSGHKLYAPKGIGVLYIRRRPRVRLLPEITGGGQERGMRSGTLPVPLIVAMGEACNISDKEMYSESLRLIELRASLLEQLKNMIPDLIINGSMKERVPGNLNISFPNTNAMDLVKSLKDVAVSTGSACSSTSKDPSYVLNALGLSPSITRGSIRIGLGRFTTQSEIDYSARSIANQVLTKKNNEKVAAE